MASMTKLGSQLLAERFREGDGDVSCVLIQSRWPPRTTNGVVRADLDRWFRVWNIDALHAVDDRIVAAWDRDIVPVLPQDPGQICMYWGGGGLIIIEGEAWWPSIDDPALHGKWINTWCLYVRNVPNPDLGFAFYLPNFGEFVLGDNAIRSS